jgi:hypothetical protein
MTQPVTIEMLGAYSRLYGLGHSQERLAELAPHVADLLGRLERLRTIDAGDVEIAISYVPVSVAGPDD